MSKRRTAESGALVYGGIPRADLMPPEVGMRRKESTRRRTLLALITLVGLATVGGVVASFFVAGAAEQRLAAERLITDQLLATQLDYADVTQARADTQVITDLRDQLGAVELLWGDVVSPYLAAIDPSATVTSLSVQGNAPAQAALVPAGPLRQERVATISLVIQAPGDTRPWEWVRSWQAIETHADSSIESVTSSDGGYTVAATINLSPEALSGRFGAQDTATSTTEGGDE